MRIDPEDLRRRYESLSDEGLLDIDRSDLTLLAQGIYDQEMVRRGLDHSEPDEDADPSADFRPGEEWDESQPGADSDESPPPQWMEDAACPWSAYMHPHTDYLVTGAEVQSALREAGIPNRILVKPPEPEPPTTPRSLYCVMVPGELAARAYSTVERAVFNRIAETEWRSQLQAFSDQELRRLNPDDLWGALLDRAKRMERAYLDEVGRRWPRGRT